MEAINVKDITRKLFSIILAVLLLLSAAPLSLPSLTGMPLASAADVWDGSSATAATQAADGYYEIATAANLKWFANQLNSGAGVSYKIRLTNDLDLNNKSWAMMGTTSYKFAGTFDGNNHTISNITMSGGAKYIGFFCYLNGAVVKDLTLSTISVTSTYDVVGILAAQINGGTTSNITVINGSVRGTSNIGGICGWTESAAIINGCTFNGLTVTGTGATCGGIAGTLTGGGTIYDCSLTGVSVSGTNNIGGVAGYVNSSSSVSGCTVTASADKYTLTGTYSVGGIVGEANNAKSIQYCVASGMTVKSTGSTTVNSFTISTTGGVLGYASGKVNCSYCYARHCNVQGAYAIGGVVGVASASGSSFVCCGAENTAVIASGSGSVRSGGFVGKVSTASSTADTFSYCYAAKVTITSAGNEIGGFVGNAENNAHQFNSCYAYATMSGVTGSSNIGAFVGWSDSSNQSNCYCNSATNGKSNTNRFTVTALTDAQCTGGTLLTGLNNVKNIWVASSDEGFPVHSTVNTIIPEFDGSYFLISDLEELNWFSTYVNGTEASAKGKLVADIDCANASITRIGTNSTNFTGTFDGQGHTVSNFTITAAGDSTAFFGATNGAVIKDLNLNNGSQAATAAHCAIGVGYMTGGSLTNVNITGFSFSTSGNQGGILVGQAQGVSSIKYCSVTGTSSMKTATSSAQYMGGLIGYNHQNGVAGEIAYNTVTNVNITSTGTFTNSSNYTNGAFTGGAIGYMNNYTVSGGVHDCYVDSCTITAMNSVGGFAGAIDHSGTTFSYIGVSNTKIVCNENDVANRGHAGGFVGQVANYSG